MLNIILFGPPGAGKGTVSERLVAERKLVHLSTGNVLRDEIKRGTPLGVEAAKLIEKGMLVPDDTATAIVRDFVKTHVPCRGFIFDGFPRTENQAASLDEIMKENGIEITMLLSMDVSEENIIKRLQNRAHIEGRTDDADISIIRTRIATYHKKTEGTIDYYKKQGKFYAIDANVDPEHVMNNANEILDQFAKF